MKILFWNTNRNTNINNYVASLVLDYDVDILVLAEYNADKEQLQMLMDEKHRKLIRANAEGSKRIDI